MNFALLLEISKYSTAGILIEFSVCYVVRKAMVLYCPIGDYDKEKSIFKT